MFEVNVLPNYQDNVKENVIPQTSVKKYSIKKRKISLMFGWKRILENIPTLPDVTYISPSPWSC